MDTSVDRGNKRIWILISIVGLLLVFGMLLLHNKLALEKEQMQLERDRIDRDIKLAEEKTAQVKLELENEKLRNEAQIERERNEKEIKLAEEKTAQQKQQNEMMARAEKLERQRIEKEIKLAQEKTAQQKYRKEILSKAMEQVNIDTEQIEFSNSTKTHRTYKSQLEKLGGEFVGYSQEDSEYDNEL